MAVNLRLAEPEKVGEIPNGLKSWNDLGRDGRRVRDMWF